MKALERAARVAACAALALVGFLLIEGSPFGQRLREDFPSFIPMLDGPASIALVLALAIAAVPLFARERFVKAFLVAAFVVSGLGAYWWTRIPWDEVITRSDFPSPFPPRTVDFALVAAPVLILVTYLAATAGARLYAEWRDRGVDADEARRVGRGVGRQALAAAGVALLLTGVVWGSFALGAVDIAARILPNGPIGISAAVGLLLLAAWGLWPQRRAAV